MKRKKILVSILIALMLGIVQPISTTVRGHNQSDTLTVENTPVEQGSESDNGENEDNNEFPTVYDNAYDTVDIANDGGITLISNHANENQVSTLALVLNLKVRDDVEEEISINNASFEFDNALYGKIKVLEYHSDYYQDSVKLTLYVSNTETVFDENGCLYLGRVIVDGISLEAIDIEKEPLEYVYHNEVACFNIAETTTTTEETTTTTEETTTTTEETTTTTEETTTTTEETTTTTTPKIQQRLSTTTSTTETSSTTTSTTETSSTTTTTSTTETSSTTTTTTTTTEPETTKATTTTTTTTTEPETTKATTTTEKIAEEVTEATTEEMTEEVTEATTEEVTEATTEEMTEEVTEATTEEMTEEVTEATTVVTTEEPTTTTATVQHIASDEDLCEWAINDYEDKTGITPANAEINQDADGQYEITLTDDTEKVLDVYVIDPNTGVGTDSNHEEVNLPQTGNNSLTNILIALSGLMTTAFGFLAVKSSGMIRRKKEEK